MKHHAHWIRALQLSGVVLALSACVESQGVRQDSSYGQPGYGQPTPYYGSQPYYDTYYGGTPYYGGGPVIIYPNVSNDVDSQIDKARASIDSGAKKGSLTKDEAQQLRSELNTIQHKADRMQRDGHLSRPEHDRLHTDLDQLRKNIKREKDDDERRRKKEEEDRRRRH